MKKIILLFIMVLISLNVSFAADDRNLDINSILNEAEKEANNPTKATDNSISNTAVIDGNITATDGRNVTVGEEGKETLFKGNLNATNGKTIKIANDDCKNNPECKVDLNSALTENKSLVTTESVKKTTPKNTEYIHQVKSLPRTGPMEWVLALLSLFLGFMFISRKTIFKKI